MAKSNLRIIKVDGNFKNCPGHRILPMIESFSNWEGSFQICEHYEGIGEIIYEKNLPLVIFHSEGDENWIDIDYFSRYGTVLHCNYKLAETKGKFFNYWAFDYKKRLEDYNQKVNVSNSFNQKFLCLNGRPDWHRYYILQRLYDKNLLENNFVSFLNRYNHFENKNSMELFLKSYNGDPCYVKGIIKDKNIIILDRSNEQIHQDDRTHESFIYEQTSISLVTETYADSKRGLFITEKSYKPIANCHFQIWIAQPGMVEFFRNLNFDVFDDIIDNSYDNEIDDIKRFESALESLEKFLREIKNFSDKDKFYYNQRLLSNQKKYFEMKISNKEIESWL
jgi:hypothetical protein